MGRLKKKIKVVECRLKSKFGDATDYGQNRFLIRLNSAHRSERSRLNTAIHEAIHVGDFNLSEKKVRQLTACVVEVLWRENYRRIRK